MHLYVWNRLDDDGRRRHTEVAPAPLRIPGGGRPPPHADLGGGTLSPRRGGLVLGSAGKLVIQASVVLDGTPVGCDGLQPARRSSWAVSAAVRAKMPVVRGHARPALDRRAGSSRTRDRLTSLPFLTVRMIASTSTGREINVVSIPNHFRSRGEMATILSSIVCLSSGFGFRPRPVASCRVVLVVGFTIALPSTRARDTPPGT